MKDSFYTWLAILMLFSMLLGSALERAKIAGPNWYDIITSALFGIAATVALVSHYRQARNSKPMEE